MSSVRQKMPETQSAQNQAEEQSRLRVKAVSTVVDSPP